MAVEDEELSRQVGVGPAHASGFFEQEHAGLAAVHAHSLILLGEVDLKRVERVVVVVNARGQIFHGERLRPDEAGRQQAYEERQQSLSIAARILEATANLTGGAWCSWCRRRDRI